MRFPTFFIPHGGGPCFFMQWDPPETWASLGAWLHAMMRELPEKPKAILVVSAHWEEKNFTVGTAVAPELIFDYYGFPPETYQLKYPVSGAAECARRTFELLQQSGIAVQENSTRGIDHGVFVPLLLVRSEADIPVFQVSLQHDLDVGAHIALGRALASLREEGVLIIGSGMSYHNLRKFFSGGRDVLPQSEAFDAWLTQALELRGDERETRLAQWEEAPFSREAHLREEHLLPLMVVASAAGEAQGKKVFSDIVMGARLSAWRFGD